MFYKRMTALLLVMLMLVTSLPFASLAQETAEDTQAVETLAPPVEEVATQEPVVEEPVVEEPVAEAPVAEEPVAEAPVAETPVADEPVAEEPVAEEPVAEEPVAEEPVVEEPVAEEPVVEEPVAEEPVVEEPMAEEPVAEEPEAEEPVVEEPVAEEPVVEETVAEETVAEETVVEEPAGSSFTSAIEVRVGSAFAAEFTREGLNKLIYTFQVSSTGDYLFVSGGDLPVEAALYKENTGLANFKPNITKEGETEATSFSHEARLARNTVYYLVVKAAKTNEFGKFNITISKAPVMEEPVADEPVAEEPVAEEPVAEEPVADEPVADEPVADEPAADEPVADEPVAEEPVADEPVAEEPVADEPVADEPIADEPVADEPVADEPVADEPVADEPVADEPVAEESVAEEPVAEESVADEPVDEEPSAEDPTSEDEKPNPPLNEERTLSKALVSADSEPDYYDGTDVEPTDKAFGLPESSHPYLNNQNLTWDLYFPGATKMVINFSDKSELEGRGWDKLYVRDRYGNALSFVDDADGSSSTYFTGTELAGLSLTITSTNYVKINLVTDSSVTRWGFEITDVVTTGYVPATPTIASTSNAGPNRVSLSWNSVSGATGYEVYRRLAGTTTAEKVYDGGLTSFTDTKVGPYQQYYYKVRAYAKINTGARYTGSFSPERLFTLPAAPLARPRINAISISNVTTVHLGWDEVPGATGYYIYRSRTAKGPYEYLKYTFQLSTTDTGAYGDEFYYRIRAYIKVGSQWIWSEYSVTECIWLREAPVVSEVYQYDRTHARISWQPVSGATGYNIYRAISGGYIYVGSVISPNTSYINFNLTPGVTYKFKVSAYKPSGLANKSLVSQHSIPKTLPMLGLSRITDAVTSSGKLRITWTAVSGAAGYHLYRSNWENGTYDLLGTYPTNSALVSATAGTRYYYKVSAYKTVNGRVIRGPYSAAFGHTFAAPRYRALLVGNSNYYYSSNLRGPANDVRNVSSMLGNLSFEGATYTRTIRTDLTASGIRSAISSTFAGANASDISLFYYSGHGVSELSSSSTGALAGVDSSLLTPAQLRAALDTIPGRIIVILDSCGSGTVIHRDPATGEMVSKQVEENPAAFNSAVIAAFAGATERVGDLTVPKYVVLTASAHGQNSVEYSGAPDYTWQGAFTKQFNRAGGWYNGSSTSLHGDANRDNIVTLNEAYYFIRNAIAADSELKQNVQVYPSGSSYPLFRR